MAAPTLSVIQTRKTLRERVKVHCKPKTHLINPYSYSWPVVEEMVAKEITEKLIDLFKSLPLCKEKLTWKERQKKRELHKSAEVIEESEDEKKRKHLRSQLVIGVNAITRSLEKDEVNLLIVCRSTEPALITKHLVPLAACRKCPALCISQFNEKIAPLLGCKSVIAIGFKKLPSEGDTEFSEFIRYGQNCAIPIDMPWAVYRTPSKETKSISEVFVKEQISVQYNEKRISVDAGEVKMEPEKCSDSSPTAEQKDVKVSKSMVPVSKFIPKDDYSYLYVFKSDKKERDWGDFIAVGQDSESSDSENSAYKHKIKREYRFNESKTISQMRSPKRRKYEADKNEMANDLSDFPRFEYKQTKIGQQFKNPNKKKRRKKFGKK